MREHFSKDKEYYEDRKNRELEECQRQLDRLRQRLKTCQSTKRAAEEKAEGKTSENKNLRIRLFHSLKEAKKYDDAEKLYHETVKRYEDDEKPYNVTLTGGGPTESESSVILDLKQSFAAMLIEQKRFQEAEPISGAVWEDRKQFPGPLSEISMESHRQLCSVLRDVGKIRDAETMHGEMYHKEPKDAWALENGDELCQRLKERGEIKSAKQTQDDVWKARLEKHGPRDALTIRSGLRLIGFLEELVTTVDGQGRTEAERRLNAMDKESFPWRIIVLLQTIWDARPHLEPTIGILDVGHRLGVVLLDRDKPSDAEAVFIPVWEGKKQKLGDRAVSTISTGGMLGKALNCQRKPETYVRAVDILRSVWPVWQTVMNGYSGAISSGEDLAHAYDSLGNWPEAERTYRWILDQKVRNRRPTPEINLIRWSLGQTLSNQGPAKDHETEGFLGELYQQWNASSPNSNQTLRCGQLLAQSMSTQNGKTTDALTLARDVFNKREALPQRGIDYLDSGRLYGSLLLKVEKFAEGERILGSVWKTQAVGIEEREMRLKCGHLYGQALAKRHKYSDAKRILDAVVASQEGNLRAGMPDIAEISQLLEDVNRLEKEKKRGKRNSTIYRRKAFGILITN